MATRAELLATLATFDTPLLERLVQYKDKIIVPDADALTKVTFNDMMDKAHALADVYFPQWTDRSKADFGEFITELMALYSEKDYVYLNMFANEGTLQKAQSYAQVYYHAIRLGYLPVRAQSSLAQVRLTFTGVPTPTTIGVGGIIIGVNGKNLQATNVSVITVPAGNSQQVINMLTGTYNQVDIAFNGQSVRWIGQDVDFRYVNLFVSTEQWTAVNNFGASDATSKNFMVYPTDGQDIEAVFGRGGYGMRPPIGAPISVQYLTCPYTDIYAPITPLTISRNMQGSYITAAVMVTEFAGGSKPEDIESIRNNASILFRTFGVNTIRQPDDAITVLEARNDVRKATAFMFGRQMYFTVIPEDGNPATIPFLQQLETDMQPVSVSGFLLSGSLTSYVTISEITATAYIYSDFDTAAVEQQIRDYFEFITDPMEGAEYGLGLDIGETALKIKELIAGVSNFVFNTVNGAPAADITLTALQIFNKIVDANLHLVVQKVS